MPDLNEEIWRLKGEGMSLRAIATALGISHVTVLKRLRAMEGNRQVITGKDRKRLPAIIERKDKQTTGFIPYPSRSCEESRDGGNQVVTKKTPSSPLNESVNPLETPSDKLPDARKEVFQGGLSEVDDLFAAIKGFLENHGVKLYQIQVSGEAYQVTNGTQVIRFYLSHINKDDMKR